MGQPLCAACVWGGGEGGGALTGAGSRCGGVDKVSRCGGVGGAWYVYVCVCVCLGGGGFFHCAGVLLSVVLVQTQLKGAAVLHTCCSSCHICPM
jgi:hypothetical protein